MSQPGPAPDWGEFRRAIHDLESRVARLEERLEPAAAAPSTRGGMALPEPGPLALFEGAAALPAVGRSLLGIAGAYLLRALTESGVLPQKAGVAAGILYFGRRPFVSRRSPPGTPRLFCSSLLWSG
jgi:hypothetical protein